MTQNKNLKRLVRTHMQKTGQSYAAALHDIQQGRPSHVPLVEVLPSSSMTPEQQVISLLAELRASPFAVQVGRVPAVARSATLSVALAQVEELSRHPRYYAESGDIEMVISESQHDLLLQAGAANDTKVQMIRSFHTEQGSTFSVRCEKCGRWIWCGKDEREGTCVCGHAYRVVFDLSKVFHWTQRRGMCCLECGTPFKMTRTIEGKNPWSPVNAGQIQCRPCQLTRSHSDAESAADGLLDEGDESRVVVYITIRFNFAERRLMWSSDIIEEEQSVDRLVAAKQAVREMGQQVIEPVLARMDKVTDRTDLVSHASEAVRGALEQSIGRWSRLVEIAAVDDGGALG